MNLVRDYFVPVALNTDRLPDSPAGEFFRALMKRWPQGLWVVTPEGQTLGFHYHQPQAGDSYQQNQRRWVQNTVQMLSDAQKAAGMLTAREIRTQNPYPDRGLGVQPTGGVRLAVSVIGLRAGQQEGPPAIDSFLLSREDWKSLAPPEGRREWEVAAEVSQKFAPAFSPLTDSIFVPRPVDVNRATLQAQVIRQSGDQLILRYRGEWQSRHLRDGNPKFPIETATTGEGVGVYDLADKSLQSLLFVLKGTYRVNNQSTPFASIIEWTAK